MTKRQKNKLIKHHHNKGGEKTLLCDYPTTPTLSRTHTMDHMTSHPSTKITPKMSSKNNHNNTSVITSQPTNINILSERPCDQASRPSDLLTRPTWIDADIALSAIDKGKALGNRSAVWFRSLLQDRFYQIGRIIHKFSGLVLSVFLVTLVFLSCGLRSAKTENNVENLWVEVGGRLAMETEYKRSVLGENFGATSEMIIQTPNTGSGSVLNSNNLLLHLEALRAGLSVTVDMFDVSWSLKDICYKYTFPTFEMYYIEQILNKINPCAIITPLDCFWEGSKLLGPEKSVDIPGIGTGLFWNNLNPELLINSIAANSYDNSRFELDTIRRFLQRAGITTAYQRKPCLNPKDPLCPTTASNYDSEDPLNIGAELTGGCYGFSTKFMHWPEDMIVGGIRKNQSGIITRAKALQSIVQLMGEQDMFQYHRDSYHVQHLDWTMEKAKTILEAWQRKFSTEIQRFISETDFAGSKNQEIQVFTSNSLMDIMKNFSQVNIYMLTLGYVVMLSYAGYSLHKRQNRIDRSQTFLGMIGVLFIGLSTAAGLGVCALSGLVFNATTTQILPFLALGIGIDNMFLIAHTYTSDFMLQNVPLKLRTAECLKQSGISLLLSTGLNIVAFLSASIIPIPALRNFSLQAAILIAFISFSNIILFPALASLDLKFRLKYFECTNHNSDNASIDSSNSFVVNMFFYICCCGAPNNLAKRKQRQQINNVHPAQACSSITTSGHSHIPSYNFYYLDVPHQTLPPERSASLDSGIDHVETIIGICHCIRPIIEDIHHRNIDDYDDYEKYRLMKKCIKCGGEIRSQCDGQDDEIFVQEGINNIENSIDITSEEFHSKISKIKTNIKQNNFKFSISFFAREFYAPLLQKTWFKCTVFLIFIAMITGSFLGTTKVHDGLELTDIVPRSTMEHKFLDLQSEYFNFYYMYAITKGNFDYPNNQKLLYEYYQSFTRVEAILKNDDGALPEFWLGMFRDWLLELQNAFDKDYSAGFITRENWNTNASDQGILGYKLLVQTGKADNPVDKSRVPTARLVEDGMINSKAFYNYLTAWFHSDPLAYAASQATFRPEPKQWQMTLQDVELKIPKSSPLIYAQIPFFLNRIRSTAEITSTIEEIRTICSRFEDKGLPNFPTGNPFTYWEQYVRLRFYLLSAIVVVLAAVFLSICLFLLNVWAALLIVFVIGVTVIQIFGFMGIVGIKLSAIPAVILIISIGIGVDFLTNITISFMTAIGNRNKRMSMALEHMFNPVMHGIVSTIIGISLLSLSEFDFIIRYFVYVLFAVVLITSFNVLVLLPVLLSIIGPEAEIVPLEHEDHLTLPTPPPSPLVGYPFSHFERAPEPIDFYGTAGAYGCNPSSQESLTQRSVSSGKKNTRPNSTFQKYCKYRAPQRVQSEISLSTISEESSTYEPTPQNTPIPPIMSAPPRSSSTSMCSSIPLATPHEILVQPEFVVETTITNNSVGRSTPQFSTSVTPTSENGSQSDISSPTPTSDRDSMSSRSDREQSGSRCSSAASFTTTTTTTAPTTVPEQSTNANGNQSTTVTTKVMAKVQLQMPQHSHHHLLQSGPTSQVYHHHHPLATLAATPNSLHPNLPAGTFFIPSHYMPAAPPLHSSQHNHHHDQCRNCVGCSGNSNNNNSSSSNSSSSSNNNSSINNTNNNNSVHHYHHHHHLPTAQQSPSILPHHPAYGQLSSFHRTSGAWNHGMINPFTTSSSRHSQNGQSNNGSRRN